MPFFLRKPPAFFRPPPGAVGARKISHAVFAVVAAFALSAAAVFDARADGEKINSVAVIVNNQSISRLEIQRQENELRRQAAARGDSVSDEDIRRRSLETLVLRVLQLQQARRLGVTVAEPMVNERLAALKQRLGAGSEDEWRRIVKSELGVSPADLREKLREDIAMEALFVREIFNRTDVYDEEIDNFLRTESGAVARREYRLHHLLIAADGSHDNPRELAESLRRRIVDGGEDFIALAREYSDGKDAARDGADLQWRAVEHLPLEFAAEAQNMAVGEVSQVITTGRGFHLLQLTDARGGDVGATESRRLRLSHLFLPPDALETADDLYRRLREGADFAELTRQHSIDDKSADKGGDLGWFFPAELPDYFEVANTLQEGETAPPLKSPFGVHLLRLEKLEVINMRDLRERARRVLRERRALAQRADWLQELRGKAYIIVIDPAYGGLLDGAAG